MSQIQVFPDLEHLKRGRPDVFFKKLTPADVSGRLVVTKAMMAMLMPRSNGSKIRAVDNLGVEHEFTLCLRDGRYLKPTFQRSGWKPFMVKTGAKPDDYIYFWPEVNEMKGTSFRIGLIPIIHGISPHPEGFGNPKGPPPESQEEISEMRALAATLSL